MIALGLSGGIDTLFSNDFDLDMDTLSHDSAAALVIDGELVAAVEEERLNRIKHTNLFPMSAIEAVLSEQHLCLDDVDAIGLYLDESFLMAAALIRQIEKRSTSMCLNIRQIIVERLAGFSLCQDLTSINEKLRFYNHHLCHAYSAIPYSSMDESLVFITDGIGEETSGMIGAFSKNNEFQTIEVFSRMQSIGIFYLTITRFLGFSHHDEYKVMGLSSFGNASTCLDLVRSLCRKNSRNQYEFLSPAEVYSCLAQELTPRAKGSQVLQIHKDLAAAMQQVVEAVILDILGFWQQKTGLRSLVMAGGVRKTRLLMVK